MPHGLSARGTQLILDGKPFRNIGVNHYDFALREIVATGFPNTGLANDIAGMRARGIRCVRLSAGWWDGATWNTQVLQSSAARANYMAGIVKVLDALAAANMGAIINMFHSLYAFANATLYKYGIKDAPKALASPLTNAGQLFAEHTTLFVQALRNHPGVWGWQLANEWAGHSCEYNKAWALNGSYSTAVMLDDIPGPDGQWPAAGDTMGMAEYQAFCRRYVDLVHANDPHGRIVVSGNAIGNAFAVRQQITGNLGKDSKGDWDGRSYTDSVPWLAQREAAFDCIEQHVYPLAIQTGGNAFYSDGPHTYQQHLAFFKAWSDQARKPAFLGEFGATRYNSGVDPVSNGSASAEATNFAAAMDGIVTSDIPLALCWNWGGAVNDAVSESRRWVLTDPTRTYQLDAIQAVNAWRT